MKKLIVLCMFVFCCAFVNAQESMVLDDAIFDSVEFFSSRLPLGTTVAITNFEAENREFADYIIQELIVSLANTGVRVVERSRLEMLESELNFNMSGLVSDETAQGIGRMIGAQVLISGSISEYRDMYRMSVQAIAVETAELLGTRTLNVRADPTLRTLLGVAWKYNLMYLGFNIGYSPSVLTELVDDREVFPSIGFSVYALLGVADPV